MKLPERFPFIVETLYNGKKLEITSEYLKEIRVVDPYCEEREKCKEQMKVKIFDPFHAFLIKYPVIKKALLTEADSVKDVLLLNLIEDAARQNISDLDECMKSSIDFLNQCMGKYTFLFKKKSQDALIDVLIKGDKPRGRAFNERRDEINNKRTNLFPKFSEAGMPKNESFESLKDEIVNLRSKVNAYRDKIAAHNDSDGTSLVVHWEDVDKCVERFTEIIFDFYTVFSFEKRFGEPHGPGICPKKTTP